MKLIKPNDVPDDAIIIDVLSSNSYNKEHIKNARNFCVYEIDFGKKIQEAFKNKNQSLYIYGLSNKTLEAHKAAQILNSIGYNDVEIIEGGLEEWKEHKLPIKSSTTSTSLENKSDGEYIIDSKKSNLTWIGRKIGKRHFGGVDIKEGHFEIMKNELIGGKIIFDMETITDHDLKDPILNQTLVNHLKSNDFFDVKNNKISILEILHVIPLNDVTSKPNYVITAQLSIKLISNIINFKAHIHEEKGELFINGHFDIDRANWDIMYGSARFFAGLNHHLVDDIITFDLILFATKVRNQV